MAFLFLNGKGEWLGSGGTFDFKIELKASAPFLVP